MRGRHDPNDHPIRIIKAVADEAVGAAVAGVRPHVRASLLISLYYSVRGERAFCEEIEYNLLFRWFLDMNLMELCLSCWTMPDSEASVPGR